MTKKSIASAIPWGSLFATVVAVAGCIAFTYNFCDAMDGFSFQVNTLISIGNFRCRPVAYGIACLFCTSCIIFLFLGALATNITTKKPTKSVDEDLEDRSFCVRFLTDPKILGFFAFCAHFLLICWIFILCFSAICLAVYFIFIMSIYAFCSLVDQKCFDFTVLLPAIASRLTNQKVDLIFCQDKKEALCSNENNQIWPFAGSFVCCLVALLGLVYFLMCMSANYSRVRDQYTARKGDHYAMNHGTVDSNSFIMQNMGK